MTNLAHMFSTSLLALTLALGQPSARRLLDASTVKERIATAFDLKKIYDYSQGTVCGCAAADTICIVSARKTAVVVIAVQPCAESLSKVAATGIGATAGGVIGGVLGKISRSAVLKCSVRRAEARRLKKIAEEEAAIHLNEVVRQFKSMASTPDFPRFLSLQSFEVEDEEAQL